MPYRAARPCAVNGCPNLVTDPNQIYCVVHAAQHMQEEYRRRKERNNTAQYGRYWTANSKRYLRKHPYCEKCGKPAEVVHHIIPRAEGGSDRWDNLMALCRACHSAIHIKENSKPRVYGYEQRG